MTNLEEHTLPGENGRWDNAPIPDDLKEAQERIRVLEEALCFYSDARSYNAESGDNEYPAYGELVEDKGTRARIGRLATTTAQYAEWLQWTLLQNIRF